MTVREIQGVLAEQYGTEVSPEFISSVTDAVMAEVAASQARPLEPMDPVIFLDAATTSNGSGSGAAANSPIHF